MSTFEAKVGRLGLVLVTVSASWDWSGYSGDHPAALVNVTPQGLEDITAACSAFGTDATVTFTRQRSGVLQPSSGEIVAEVTGGSVYELVVAPDPRVTAAAQGGTCPAIGFPSIDGTINESILNFEADPDEPNTPRGSISGSRFAGRIGRITGTIRTVFNSCTGEASSFIASDVERP